MSAQSRAEADWLVGLNVTRALTCKFNAQLSAGRVQTPTLALLVQREEEIRRFVPKDYYTVRADLGNFFVTWHNGKNQTAISDKEKADAIAEKIREKKFRITEVKKTFGSTPPPMLYDLTELQRDANKLYQYSPKQTLNIMQRLYETHKALTYPRTDSRYLTADLVPTLPGAPACGEPRGVWPHCRGDIPYPEEHFPCVRQQCEGDRSSCDHPHGGAGQFAQLGTRKRKGSIRWSSNGFLTCFYPSYDFKKIRVELTAEGESFSAAGREIIELGWKKVEKGIEEDERRCRRAGTSKPAPRGFLCV